MRVRAIAKWAFLLVCGLVASGILLYVLIAERGSQGERQGPEPRAADSSSRSAILVRAPERRVKTQVAPSASFRENLAELERLAGTRQDLEVLTWQTAELVQALLADLAGNESLVRSEFARNELPPFYRAILLTCLVRGGLPGVADIVWRTALDPDESIDVRRVAAYLLRRLQTDTSRPDLFLELLRTPDTDLRMAILKVAPTHMDKRGLAEAKRLVAENTDTALRVTALHAVGESRFDGTQGFLLQQVTNRHTSAETPFSESSILKRTALWHLDAGVPKNAALARRMALDQREDPGVRRKAILKVAESGADDAGAFVVALMEDLEDREAVLLKGCLEALLCIDQARWQEAAENRVAAVADLQVRRMLELQLSPSPHAMEAGTQ